MHVLLFNGSPHQNGCTYTALSEVKKALEESGATAEILWIGKKAVQGCIACNKCEELDRCVFRDEVYNAAIEKLYFHQSPFAQARTSCSEVATLSPRIESASPDLTVAPLASDSSVARLLAPLALPPCEKKGIISLPERS